MSSGLFLCLVSSIFLAQSSLQATPRLRASALRRRGTTRPPDPLGRFVYRSTRSGDGDGRLFAARHLTGTLRSRLGRHSRPLSSSTRESLKFFSGARQHLLECCSRNQFPATELNDRQFPCTGCFVGSGPSNAEYLRGLGDGQNQALTGYRLHMSPLQCLLYLVFYKSILCLLVN